MALRPVLLVLQIHSLQGVDSTRSTPCKGTRVARSSGIVRRGTISEQFDHLITQRLGHLHDAYGHVAERQSDAQLLLVFLPVYVAQFLIFQRRSRRCGRGRSLPRADQHVVVHEQVRVVGPLGGGLWGRWGEGGGPPLSVNQSTKRASVREGTLRTIQVFVGDGKI